MDNFFSSYELGQKLLSKNITMVGTLRKNKRSIPPKLLECKKKPLYSSTFAFTENTTLVSYIGRKNKCTILQSTFHHSKEVNSGEKKLPSIVEFYNKTKGGVDTADKMLSGYTCKRKTGRWPMAVFANIIDISALNAFIIYKEVDPNWSIDKKTRARREFLPELGLSLAKPYMKNRNFIPRSKPLASIVEELSDDIPSTSSKQPKKTPLTGRKRCHICVKEGRDSKDNKYETVCTFCDGGACKKVHNRNVCVSCLEKKLS